MTISTCHFSMIVEKRHIYISPNSHLPFFRERPETVLVLLIQLVYAVFSGLIGLESSRRSQFYLSAVCCFSNFSCAIRAACQFRAAITFPVWPSRNIGFSILTRRSQIVTNMWRRKARDPSRSTRKIFCERTQEYSLVEWNLHGPISETVFNFSGDNIITDQLDIIFKRRCKYSITILYYFR